MNRDDETLTEIYADMAEARRDRRVVGPEEDVPGLVRVPNRRREVGLDNRRRRLVRLKSQIGHTTGLQVYSKPT